VNCWKETPKERPNFSKLVDTISLILEASAGYMKFSMSIKDEHPLAAKAEVKTRESDYVVNIYFYSSKLNIISCKHYMHVSATFCLYQFLLLLICASHYFCMERFAWLCN